MKEGVSIRLVPEIKLWLQQQPRSFNFSEYVNRLIITDLREKETKGIPKKDKFTGLVRVRGPDGSSFWVKQDSKFINNDGVYFE